MRSLVFIIYVAVVDAYLSKGRTVLPSKIPKTRIVRMTSSSVTPSPIAQDESSSQDFSEVITGNSKSVPIGSVPVFAIPGDSVEETFSQRTAFSAHWLLTASNLAIALAHYHFTGLSSMALFASVVAASVVVGDFATGVFHWATDNYGNINTPVFGTVCAAFQGHHITPYTITFRSFVNNVYKICYATVPVLALLAIGQLYLGMKPLVNIFFVLFTNWWMISQELHKYAHMRQVPSVVKALQQSGVILSKKEHGLHHTAPFEGHYCILTGVCNKFLDDSKFFRYLENIVYKLTGNKANTWKECTGGDAIEKQAMSIFN